MALKLITDVAAVRARYSLQDHVDINAAITSSLNSAHVFFQGILGTVFEENLARKDAFHLDDEIIPTLGGMFRCRLKQAFVEPGSISVRYAATRKLVLDALTSTEVPAEDYVLDAAKGLLYIDAEGYTGQYLLVTYDAGFGTTTLLTAPDWLIEAVLSWMAVVPLYSSHGDDATKSVKVAQEIQRNAAAMVDRHKRESGAQVLPLY